MNTIFFGTSDRTRPILKALKENTNLLFCVTKTDKKIGRKQVLKETGVKKWCKENNMNYIEIGSLKGNDLEKVIDKVKVMMNKYKNDFYGVVTDFSFIIPPEIINLFNEKIINIHFSLLPKYRGASPVQFAILNGDKLTGITYQLVDNELDKGDIITQIEYNIPDNFDSGQVYDELFNLAAENLPLILNNYANRTLSPTPQKESETSYTYSKSHPDATYIFKEDARIDWTQSAEKIERKVKAFSPWPIAWTYLKDMEKAQSIYPTNIKFKDHINTCLTAKIHDAEIIKSKIKINEIQVEGKTKTDWKSFENGYLILSDN